MRVNYEVREMLLQGIVRPEDISSANTIPYEKIAEGRFSYAGRGQLDDMQQPPYGQQVLNALSPF
jgi:flagellar L-ring protein precursor FlgH